MGWWNMWWQPAKQRDMARHNTEMIRRKVSLRLKKSQRDLRNITGDPEDVQVDAELACGETALTFHEVTFAVRERRGKAERLILAPMSGHFEPGTLVALMGPSGCGKSTLLDILAGKKTNHGGAVHVNGRPRDRFFRRMTAYVPQEDVMPGHLTVEEAIVFHRTLREERPSKLRPDIARRLLQQRLEVLGLAEIKDSFIGDDFVRGISGGQKRRLSLAKGLDAGAQLIFCDEPTSGLSATDAEACVRYMRLMAHKYCVTIIVVIHQPRVEVARLFDHLLLLTSQPGRVVYNGLMRELPSHCEAFGSPVPLHANPTDFCMDLVTPGRSRSRVDKFLEHYNTMCKPAVLAMVEAEFNRERRTPLEILETRRERLLQFGYLPPVRPSIYGVGFTKQLQMLFQRQLRLRMRDKLFVIADFAVAIAKAVVVGTAYSGISEKPAALQAGFFFMVLMACSLDGLKAMPRIISERDIMKRETSEALYSEWAYIIPFTLIGGAQALIANTLFISLLVVISGLDWAFFPSLFWWSTLLYFTMDGLYLMIASIARTTASAQVLSLPFLMTFLMYNGFTVTKATCPSWLRWALSVSPVAYAMEGVVIAASEVSADPSWDWTVEHFGYVKRPHAAFAVMLGCTALFRASQLVCLRVLNNLHR